MECVACTFSAKHYTTVQLSYPQNTSDAFSDLEDKICPTTTYMEYRVLPTIKKCIVITHVAVWLGDVPYEMDALGVSVAEGVLLGVPVLVLLELDVDDGDGVLLGVDVHEGVGSAGASAIPWNSCQLSESSERASCMCMSASKTIQHYTETGPV